MKSFNEFLEESNITNQEELEVLQKSIKMKVLKKGDIIQREGDLHTEVFFVKKGLLRSYSIDKKGKEHIFMFASEGWIMGDNTPLDQRSELFIDVIEDSEVEVVNREVINKILIPSNDNNESQIKSLMRRVAVLQKRIIMLMSATAIERYEHFVDTYPDIIQRAPQKMIASYLGITPEALSKVKSERFKKK